MNAYIVCEGKRDAQVLICVLPEELMNNVEVVAAGGLYAVKSMARSLIVRRQIPVAIVADADTVVPEQVEERLRSTEEIVGSVAAYTPFKVILAVPEIEAIFFHDISLLSRLLGYKPSQDVVNLAFYQPKQALKQLFSQSKNCQSQSQLIRQLKKEDIEILRQAPVIQEVVEFLQSVGEAVVAV